MKRWPHLSDFFALHPFADEEMTLPGTTDAAPQDSRWQKIKFDNTIRAWIAVPTFLACCLLSVQGVIPAFWPIGIVFGVYGILQLAFHWYFLGKRHRRVFDFVLTGLDMISMSLAVYFTGGKDSPLYFLYFIPLIVHAFHRDSGIVMFNGIGGVTLYALTIFGPLPNMSWVLMGNLIARLFFMLLTVGVACLAIAVLKRKDQYHTRQAKRLESQTRLSEMLNQVVMLSDIEAVKAALASLISEGLGHDIRLEMRLDVAEANAMTPALTVSEESVPYGVCIPVAGSENESFGEMCISSAVSHTFQREEMSFLRFVARSLGLSIQRVLRMEELRRSLEMNSCVMAATIASVRSTEDTYRAVLEGIVTVLNVEKAELLIWNEGIQAYCRVQGRGSMFSVERQTSFFLKTLRGEKLGEIRAERSASSKAFRQKDLELADTFVARAALAIENAHAHLRERNDIGRAA